MTQEEALNTLMKMRAWRAWGKEQKEEERPEMPEQKEVDEAFDVCIELLQQPPLPSNLDEAAEVYGSKEYAHAIHFWDEGMSKNKPEVLKSDFVNSFKAGAEWMAGQGETVSGIITKVGDKLDVETTEYLIPEESEFERCDKVIVQIRKA
jgi:hypothetical protein